MEIKELIEKYELQRNVVAELIQMSEPEEDSSTQLAVRRFLSAFISDLKELESSHTSVQSNVGVHDVEEFYKDVCECHAPTYRDKYGDHRCTQCEMLANRD